MVNTVHYWRDHQFNIRKYDDGKKIFDACGPPWLIFALGQWCKLPDSPVSVIEFLDGLYPEEDR
jgi:hypothetical protein